MVFIPTWIWDLLELFHLKLSSNQLAGSFPSRIQDWHPSTFTIWICTITIYKVLFPYRRHLVLYCCACPITNLHLQFLQIFGNISSMWYFSLSRNNISGKIPNFICNNYKQVLDLLNNMLSSIFFANLTINILNLRVLNLGNNRLQGHMLGFQNSIKL